MKNETPASQQELKAALVKSFKKIDDYIDRIVKKEKDWWDPEEFDKETGAVALDQIGCFNCHAIPKKLMTCSRCKIAVYCNIDCQKEDWKKNHKRGVCKTFCENRDDRVPLVMNLVSCGYCDETELNMGTKLRTNAFFRIIKERKETRKAIALVMSVTERFGKIRLQGEVKWLTDDFTEVRCEFVLFEVVDEGPVAEALINAPPSGKLTPQGREKTMKAIENYAKKIHAAGASVISTTLGRGLTEEIGEEGEVHRRMIGTGCEVMMAPMCAVNHSLGSSMFEAMSAMMNA